MKKILFYLKKYYICFIIVSLALITDLFTKYLATIYLTDIIGATIYPKQSVEVIKGFFYFTYTQNNGGGWSIFAGKMWLFIVITIISLFAFIYFLKDFDLKKRPLYSLGFSLMLGGTLGNFYERIANGYVTDFFDFIIFGYDYPIFNVADICLVIGVIAVIVQLIFFSDQVTIFNKKEKEEDKKEEKAE